MLTWIFLPKVQIKVDIITSMVLFDDINWGWGRGGAQYIFYAILMFKVLLFFVSLIAFSACAILGVKLFVFIFGAFFYLFVAVCIVFLILSWCICI